MTSTPRVTVKCLRIHQHGNPLQVVDMGQTALDEETFDDYLAEMREQYTADKVSRCEPFCGCAIDRSYPLVSPPR